MNQTNQQTILVAVSDVFFYTKIRDALLPKGYRLALSVRGTDYVFPGEPGAGLETLGKVWTGVGPFTHNDPRDRPPTVFGGDVTLHAGPDCAAHVLLPVIPKK